VLALNGWMCPIRLMGHVRQLAVAVVICLGVATATAAERVDSTPQEVFDAMRGSFEPSKAKGAERAGRRPMVD
jgi:hypothetical protein